MTKLLILSAALLVALGHAFAPLQSSPKTSTHLYGFFDFKPFHGHGSGEGDADLDEQWETQQAILRERRGHIDKAHLKAKYKNAKDMTAPQLHAREKEHFAWEDSYVEGGAPKKKNKMKFFWEK